MEHPKPAHKNELRKVLGMSFGIAVLVGGTIGVGILRTPGTIANLLQNYWLVVLCWIFGGLYALIGVASFAELATMMPKAGGAYNYVKRAFGDYAGFLVGWFDFFVNVVAPSYFCIVIAEYTAMLFPSLLGYEKLVAVAFLLVFLGIHVGGIRSGSVAQQVTSVIKVIVFAVLIGACFFANVQRPAIATTVPLLGGGLMIATLRALQLIVGAYDGWWVVSFFAEEDKDPGRNIPRALFTGVITVMAIYVLLNLAIFHVVSVNAIANPALAASDAASIVFGARGATFMVVIAIASLLSILNAYMMVPPRILLALSRDGYFVKQGLSVNAGGTPVFSLLVSTTVSIVLIFAGTFEQLFSLATFMALVMLGLCYAAVIKLRNAEPSAPRPYRAWGYPYTPAIAILVTLALFVGFAISDQRNFILIIAAAAVSYPAFRYIARHR